MNRRALLQLTAALSAWSPFARLRAFSQAPALTPAFSEDQRAALAAIADVTLPLSIGAAGRAAATEKFIRWHVNYRAGADMGHSYGASTLRLTSPAPVAPRYAAQFAGLDQAARAQGASSFAAASAAVRRSVVEAALNTPQPVTRMPARPSGANLVADFMGLYFNSQAAFDQAYRASIGREECRELAGSDRAPAPLTSGSPARGTIGEER